MGETLKSLKEKAFRFKKFRQVIFFAGLFLFIFFSRAEAATLSVSPSAGTFTVGSTFKVNLFLNTEGESINAAEASLGFPADKLQLISPSTGQSIITVWLAQPKFNNQAGRIDLVGGMPGGINVSGGLITTLEFRVKSVGPAVIKFLDNSKVLLNDGRGTDGLSNTQNGVYNLILPPPEGPVVGSETHPNQDVWYTAPDVELHWALAGNDDDAGFSYVLNEESITNPDDISEGLKHNVAYKNLSDGVKFFHIKALRDGIWGGVTHFAIKIDTTPPAEFPIEISPSAITTRKVPIIEFATTDESSGVSHYEIKTISLTAPTDGSESAGEENIFIEATSPFVTQPLQAGTYDVIVRAFDNAGNIRETVKRLRILPAVFSFAQERGLEVGGVIIPWIAILAILAVIAGGLFVLARKIRAWRYNVEQTAKNGASEDLQKKLEELKKYKQKYGHLAILLCLVSSLFLGRAAQAQEEMGIAPPYVDTVSRNINNNEIFYIGGKTESANTDVVIYIQNLQNGDARSFNVLSDRKGEWFYRHSGFLESGSYLLWAQSRKGDEASPPSPQVQMEVTRTALQFGASRISYELLYLALSIILLAAVLGLAVYIIMHAREGRKRHKLFLKEVREAEEAVRRGFAVLRRDIKAELEVIHKAKSGASLSQDEKIREEQLLQDLEHFERFIGKEILDVELTDRSG